MPTDSYPNQEWIFITDTEQYAGNFEREMCAFMTGMVGECKVGWEEAVLFYEQLGLVEKDADWNGLNVQNCHEDFKNPFVNFVMNRADEHGCHRPTSIWPTPGWFNDGMGNCSKGEGKFSAYQSVAIFFEQKPTQELINLMINRVKAFAKEHGANKLSQKLQPLTITGFRLISEDTTQTQEDSWKA